MTRSGEPAPSEKVTANFRTIVCAQLLTKLADALASPKTVLPWIMSGVQAPVALTGFLVPIRESGSLIPQLFIASRVRTRAVRKWIWVVGSAVQAACVAGMGLVAWHLRGSAAGAAILALLVLFSLARSFCSVAAKDVLGKTIPAQQRGRITGFAASGAGAISVVVGAALMLPLAANGAAGDYAILLLVAGFLWLAGAAVYSRVSESPGAVDSAGSAAGKLARRAALLATDRPFRLFVLTRAALLCSALSGPYYILMAREISGHEGSLLGSFIVAGGVASFLSAPLWGRYADHSSRRVMTAAAIVSALLGVIVYIIVEYRMGIAEHAMFFPAAYFVLSVAHDGARVGRKTYVVDMAEGNQRTDYVSVSNTVIGLTLLLGGLTGTLSEVLSLADIVLLLSGFGLLGAALSTRLKDVE